MTSEEKVVISARVTRSSAQGWRTFCEANGISLSAMLEVVGKILIEDRATAEQFFGTEIAMQARAIDIQRRSRR